MVLIFHSFKGFSDLEDFWDDLPVSRLKYNALDDFQEVQTTYWKSSDEVSSDEVSRRSLPTKSPDEVSRRSLPFIIDLSDMDLICKFSDQEDFWDDLPVSLLKYNALDDFHEVFQTTSRKSSDEVFFHIKSSPRLSL
ncbi:hypothetical protein F2Q70_00016658 [Brassica cretica]|uniref:Uncharacterized protein n=1 Tax=Brassica cretica TaxID=69181 RepID=A0A8S9HXT1_BRACR|nr:hypothetical protein F2Q70_00016658 [Brassica cretica]